MTTTPARRNSFQEVFGAGARPLRRSVPQAKTLKAGPAPEFRRLAEIKAASASPATPRSVAAPPAVDTSWFRPSAPVSLSALEQALFQAGLNPADFQFEQVEADGEFPGRPDLSYTSRQVVIRGPHGAGMFDRDLVLRSPWVTAVELRSYGIA
jgi:hypothetical protein